jgi:hypothetical protein
MAPWKGDEPARKADTYTRLHSEKKQTYIYASNGIRTHDSSL